MLSIYPVAVAGYVHVGGVQVHDVSEEQARAHLTLPHQSSTRVLQPEVDYR